MNTHIALTITELFDLAGYWDDSGASRVDGTAGDGDTILCTFSGTHDRGATDNILYPSANVSIIGPSNHTLTLQCRFFQAGGAGTANASQISDVIFDSKGYAALPASFDVGFSVTTKNAIKDQSCVLDSADFIDSVGGVSANTLTLMSTAASSGVMVYMNACTISGGGLDGLSTKKDSNSTANLSTLVTQACTISTNGTGSGDQGSTEHGGWYHNDFGSSMTCTTGGKAYSKATSSLGLVQFVNTSFTGGVEYFDFMAGVTVDCNSIDDAVRPGGSAGMVIKQTRIHNWRTASISDTGLRIGYSTGDLTLDRVELENAEGTAIDFAASGCTLTATDCTAFGGIGRGIDARSGSATAATRCVFDVDNFSYLDDSGQNRVTLTNCKSASAGFNVDATSGGSTVGAIGQADLDDAVAGVRIQPEPTPSLLIGRILSGAGSPLLGMTAVSVATQYRARRDRMLRQRTRTRQQ